MKSLRVFISDHRTISVPVLFGALAISAAFPVHAESEEIQALKRMIEQQQIQIDRLAKQVGTQKESQQAIESKTAQQQSTTGLFAKNNIEVYGLLNAALENIAVTGATLATTPVAAGAMQAANSGVNYARRGRLTPGSTSLGFRGNFGLSDNVKAIWQVEAGITMDGDQAPVGPANGLGTRNSHIGLNGNFGTISAGIWDTPYKFARYAVSPMRGAIPGDEVSLLGNPGFGVAQTTTQSARVATSADASFDRRQGNSIQYWTPNLNGFSGRLAYSFGENKSASNAAVEIAPRLWSMLATYAGNGLVVHYAYEKHVDYFGLSQMGGSAGATATNTSSNDYGSKLVVAYSFGKTKLTGTAERLSYSTNEQTAGQLNGYRRNAYYFTAEQGLGGGKAFVGFGRADQGSCDRAGGALCTTDGQGARHVLLGYAHNLKKDVDVVGTVYRITNDSSARYGVFPPLGGTAFGTGADASGFSLSTVTLF